MKKAIKIMAVILAVVLLIAIGAALFINIKGIPSYETREVDFELKADSAAVEEGARIAVMICSECHRGDDGHLSGKRMIDLPKEFGTAYAANITQHPTHGIADYSPAELAFFLRTGIKKDGNYAPPWMPKFPHLSDSDLNAIIAFLKSDHRLVQPSDKQHPPNEPSFMTKALCNFVFKPLPYPDNAIHAPDTSDLVAYGNYLATAKVECYSCHSADFKTANAMEPEKSEGFMGGGNPIPDLEGNIVYSANLTPHETGLADWTYEDFEQAVRWGRGPNGRAIRYPMPKFTVMKDHEVRALWAYLQTLPPIENEVDRKYDEAQAN